MALKTAVIAQTYGFIILIFLAILIIFCDFLYWIINYIVADFRLSCNSLQARLNKWYNAILYVLPKSIYFVLYVNGSGNILIRFVLIFMDWWRNDIFTVICLKQEDAQMIVARLRLSLIKLDDLLNVIRPSGLVASDAILDAIKERSEKKSGELTYRGFLRKYQFFLMCILSFLVQ